MYKLIVNPLAGKGKSVNALNSVTAVLDENGIEYEVFKTDSIAHQNTVIAQLSARPSNIIIFGGDGTISDVLNSIDNFDNVNLGIIPCGTGNDFATSLGLSENPRTAINQIINSQPTYVDYIQTEGRKCMNVCGMGIDSDVLIHYNKRKVKGRVGYMLSLLYCLIFFKWKKFELTVDGNYFGKKTAMIVAAANGKYFGGGMVISPKSQVDDGLLDIIIVNKISKFKFLLPLISLKRGSLLKYKFVEHIRAKKVEMTTTARPLINIDGELVCCERFCCEIVSNKLKVFMQKKDGINNEN